jgi:O-antigen ligase
LFTSFFTSLILPIFSKQISLFYPEFNQNIAQRLDLSYLAGKMVSERFWVGEGLNTFIVNIPRFKGINSYSWLLQPVHNVPQLVLSETGIFGVVALFLLFFAAIKKLLETRNLNLTLAILFVATTWVADHYWFTLQQNLLLVSILLGLSFKMTSSWKKH